MFLGAGAGLLIGAVVGLIAGSGASRMAVSYISTVIAAPSVY